MAVEAIRVGRAEPPEGLSGRGVGGSKKVVVKSTVLTPMSPYTTLSTPDPLFFLFPQWVIEFSI
jgi:hypothetical protein